MEKVSNKSLVASIILKFGLPAKRIDYEALGNWLHRNFGTKLEESARIEDIAKEMDFDIKTVRELTEEEIEYLESLQGDYLKEKMELISVEEFILRQFEEVCMYCGELDDYTKIQLEAIKRLVEKEEVVIENKHNSYLGDYKMVVPTLKGRVIGKKVYYEADIEHFRKRIAKVGIDPAIIDDEYLEFAVRKDQGIVYDEVLMEYCILKGIALSEGITFSVEPKKISRFKLIRTEEGQQEDLERLLATREENTTICLIEPKDFDFNYYSILHKAFMNWNSVNTKEQSEAIQKQKQYSGASADQILDDLINQGTYNVQIVIETKMVDGEPKHKVRGYIHRDRTCVELGINPFYLKELDQSQSLKLK